MTDPLLAFATNVDRQVFALKNLPEEVVAVLFAYYSRSREDLRTNLRKLLDDQDLAVVALPGESAQGPTLATAQEKARAFHERWVVGYGHASVAEHGVVHLGVEQCSIVAAKAIEEARLAAYTEKSTRYVRFSETTLVTDIGLPGALQSVYESAARASLAAYAALLDRAEERLTEKHPVPDGVSPKAHANGLRAHALDLLRGVLPAGVPTNVGLTLNGRVLEHHLSKLLGSPLAEIRRLAEGMRDEGRKILPTLLKYTEPRAFRVESAARVAATVPSALADRVVLPSASTLEATPSGRANGPVPHVVRMIAAPDAASALRTIATAILVDAGHHAWDAAWSAMADGERALAVFRAYMADRGRHDAPLRALEQVGIKLEIVCDYGAWRDLQRHRLLSASTPLFGAHEGYWFSDEIDELGLGGDVRRSVESAFEPWRKLAAMHPWEAQYVVPLAYRVRYIAQANVRELFHLTELRSARQGHESYRAVAIGVADRAIEAMPFLAEFLRVDRAKYDYARH